MCAINNKSIKKVSFYKNNNTGIMIEELENNMFRINGTLICGEQMLKEILE